MTPHIDWDNVGPYYSVDVIDGPCAGLGGLALGWDMDGVLVEFCGFRIPCWAAIRPHRIPWENAAIYCPLDPPRRQQGNKP